MSTDMFYRFTKKKLRWLQRARFMEIVETDDKNQLRSVVGPSRKQPLLLFEVEVHRNTGSLDAATVLENLVWNGGQRYAWVGFLDGKKCILPSNFNVYISCRLGLKDLKVLQTTAADIEKSLMTQAP